MTTPSRTTCARLAEQLAGSGMFAGLRAAGRAAEALAAAVAGMPRPRISGELTARWPR